MRIKQEAHDETGEKKQNRRKSRTKNPGQKEKKVKSGKAGTIGPRFQAPAPSLTPCLTDVRNVRRGTTLLALVMMRTRRARPRNVYCSWQTSASFAPPPPPPPLSLCVSLRLAEFVSVSVTVTRSLSLPPPSLSLSLSLSISLSSLPLSPPSYFFLTLSVSPSLSVSISIRLFMYCVSACLSHPTLQPPPCLYLRISHPGFSIFVPTKCLMVA